MYISPISSHRNINSKAKFLLLAEKNLLPQGAEEQLIEKAKTIGKPEDTIHAVVQKNNWSGQTVINTAFLKFHTNRFIHHVANTVKGSFQERQMLAFITIDKYIETLKQK